MRTAALVLAAAGFFFLAACGGSSEISTSAPVVDDSVTSVTVAKAVLGGPPSCAQNAQATYDRKSHVLSWASCNADAGATPVTTRTLTGSEAAQVDATLRAIALRPAAEQVCGGYDGLDYYLTTVGSVGHSVRYSASDINCYGTKQVTGLSETYSLLDKLR